MDGGRDRRFKSTVGEVFKVSFLEVLLRGVSGFGPHYSEASPHLYALRTSA